MLLCMRSTSAHYSMTKVSLVVTLLAIAIIMVREIVLQPVNLIMKGFHGCCNHVYKSTFFFFQFVMALFNSKYH